jgi:hypothetical protein
MCGTIGDGIDANHATEHTTAMPNAASEPPPEPRDGPPDPRAIIGEALAGARQFAVFMALHEFGIARHLADRPADVHDLAARAGISLRGAQALLDVLVSLGFATVHDGVYRNSPAGDEYHVPGGAGYAGDE